MHITEAQLAEFVKMQTSQSRRSALEIKDEINKQLTRLREIGLNVSEVEIKFRRYQNLEEAQEEIVCVGVDFSIEAGG